MDVSLLNISDIETGVSFRLRDEPGGCPKFWPGGVRHGGDVSLICCFRTERGKACPDTDTGIVVSRGSASSSGNCEALSTDAGRAGGPACSSGEAAVMAVERRGRTIRVVHVVNQRLLGGAG